MTAYDVVFSKESSTRYMQKDAGIGSLIKNTRRGIQRASQQKAIAKEYKKMKKFDARQADYANRANAMRAASDDTLNNAAAQSGWRNLWGNIKGSNQAGKADDLMVRSNDAMKASVRRQMAIEKQLVAQGATPEQARAIMRNNNAQKYLQQGDARGAINLQSTRDRRMQAVADGRARQQAAQAAAQPAAQPAAQATQQTAQVSQPAAQAASQAAQPAAQAAHVSTQPAAQAANNALNGGGGFSATFGNATDTMSGNANTVSQHINLNKNFGKAAPRKQMVGSGTTQQGKMTAQQAAPTNVANTNAQTKAVANDAMNGPAPTAVNNQPITPANTALQPTAQATATNYPVATAGADVADAVAAPTGQGMSLLEKAQLAGSAANMVMPLMMYQMMGQQQTTS